MLLLVNASLTESPLSCDPLIPEECILPFPNDFWLKDGVVRLQNDTLPAPKIGKVGNCDKALVSTCLLSCAFRPRLQPINPYKLGVNEMDGFSQFPAIVSLFSSLDLSNVPSHKNIAPSLDNNCPTVLIDSSTGDRVAHWGEVRVSL